MGERIPNRLQVTPMHLLEPMPNLSPVHVFKRPFMVNLPFVRIILPSKFCACETFHKQISHVVYTIDKSTCESVHAQATVGYIKQRLHFGPPTFKFGFKLDWSEWKDNESGYVVEMKK